MMNPAPHTPNSTHSLRPSSNLTPPRSLLNPYNPNYECIITSANKNIRLSASALSEQTRSRSVHSLALDRAGLENTAPFYKGWNARSGTPPPSNELAFRVGGDEDRRLGGKHR